MFSVYCIYSASLDRIYIGQTSNLQKRIKEHQRGYSKYTSRAKDWELIYSEQVDSRSAAFKLEKQLKSAAGRKFLRGLFGNDNHVSSQPKG